MRSFFLLPALLINLMFSCHAEELKDFGLSTHLMAYCRIAFWETTPTEPLAVKLAAMQECFNKVYPEANIKIYVAPDAALLPIKGWEGEYEFFLVHGPTSVEHLLQVLCDMKGGLEYWFEPENRIIVWYNVEYVRKMEQRYLDSLKEKPASTEAP